jgi:hypothetical protein
MYRLTSYRLFIFGPYVLCRNGYVQDVSYHYAEYHGHQVPWK